MDGPRFEEAPSFVKNESTKRSTKFPPDVMERAMRVVFEVREESGSQWAAIVSIAGQMDVSEILRVRSCHELNLMRP